VPFGIGAQTIRLIIGGIVLLSSLMIGYFAPIEEKSIKTHISFISPSFTIENIKNGGIGILFPTTGWGEERYGKLIMDILGDVITNDRRSLRVIHPNRGLELIDREGLTKEYALAKENYENTGEWDKGFLKRIGKAIGARYLVQPIMTRFEHASSNRSARVNVLGVRVLNTRESTIRLSIQIWDSINGNIVWEGFIEVSIMDDTIKSKPVRFYEVARVAFERLINEIPEGFVRISVKGEGK
jgi:hypothetical protein